MNNDEINKIEQIISQLTHLKEHRKATNSEVGYTFLVDEDFFDGDAPMPFFSEKEELEEYININFDRDEVSIETLKLTKTKYLAMMTIFEYSDIESPSDVLKAIANNDENECWDLLSEVDDELEIGRDYYRYFLSNQLGMYVSGYFRDPFDIESCDYKKTKSFPEFLLDAIKDLITVLER